jgi:hypothetical protein
MRQVFFVAYNGEPLYAFDSREDAEDYIREACRQGTPFHTMRVGRLYYFADINTGVRSIKAD